MTTYVDEAIIKLGWWNKYIRACYFNFVLGGQFDNSMGVRKRTDSNLPHS